MGWNSEDGILEKEVDNSHEMGNYEPEVEKQANNAIAESQVTGSQYKLMQGNGKYSRERSKEIIEREMPGARKEIPKAETSNCYGDAAGRSGAKDLEENDTFAGVK